MTDETLPGTEAIHAGSGGLDTFDTVRLVTAIVAENRGAQEATERAVGVIAKAADAIVERLRSGGRLHYVGAGTSGRLGVLDASEIPPTFGMPPELVRGHIAGGIAALTRSVEGAEDDAPAGEREMRETVKAGDAVVGISASGGAPYVLAAMRAAREIGAFTIGVCNDASAPLARAVDRAIVVETGPEVLAGSTRLKAGTAQKLVLNALSTATMIRLGKTYDNLMIDVVASNEKLRRRALRFVTLLVRTDESRASALLDQAAGSVKVAVVIGRRGVNAEEARTLLEREKGFLRAIIG
jgi:N-acetylmuramic acid 6-phosphate etherase